MRILTLFGTYLLITVGVVLASVFFRLNVFGLSALLLGIVLVQFVYRLWRGDRPKPFTLIRSCLELLGIISIVYALNVLLSGHGLLAFILICIVLAAWRMWRSREYMKETIRWGVEQLWGEQK